MTIMFILIKNSFKIINFKKSFKFQYFFNICCDKNYWKLDTNSLVSYITTTATTATNTTYNNTTTAYNNNNYSNNNNVNESLKNHIIKKLNESFKSWVSLTNKEVDFSNKISSISNNILLNLINDQIFIQNKPFDNKKLLESVKLISKALKSCPSDLNLVNDGYIDIGSLLVLYKQKIEVNHQIFTQINNHHDKISNKIQKNYNNWNEIVNDTISLNTYSNAAKNMGNKKWVKDGNKWIENYALSFFRRNGARKNYIKNLQNNYKETYGCQFPKNEFEIISNQLSRDLIINDNYQIGNNNNNNNNKIKLLDVGSCYNPILQSEFANAFDITAIDLYPGNKTVKHCDFLNLKIGSIDSEPIYKNIKLDDNILEIQSITQLPAHSYDVVVMSLVLSYLPTPNQRIEMIKNARKLLRNSNHNNQPHYSGLLLIVEKESIFTYDKILDITNQFKNRKVNIKEIITDSNDLSIDKLQRNNDYNRDLITGWKESIISEGFSLIKYRNLQSDSRKCHTFAFMTKGVLASESFLEKKNILNQPIMWIKQDFITDSNSIEQSIVSTTNQINEIIRNDKEQFISSSITKKINQLPVAILGGGLGGCALANSLQRRGIPFFLYEKDNNFEQRKQGYALTMQQGTSALKTLGLGEDIKKIGVSSYSHHSFSSNGEILGAYGIGVNSIHNNKIDMNNETKKENDKHNIHIPRQVLRELLLRNINPSYIKWNKKLIKFDDSHSLNEEVKLYFEDGCVDSASMLVSADGIHSTIRHQLLDSAIINNNKSLNYLDLMVILGISSLIPIIDQNNKTKFVTLSEYNNNNNNNNNNNSIKRKQLQWLDGDVRVFTMPFDKDKTMWQLSYHLDEYSAKILTGKPKLLKKEALSKCFNWDTALLDLLQSTNEDMISGHPAYDRDPFEWPLGSRKINPYSRVSFIGDSIHPMSPFKGQGANQALVDAISLANTIASSNITRSDRRHISEALNLFEKDMSIRSKPKVIKSRNAAIYLHSKSALNYGNITRSMAAELEYDKLK